MARNGSGTYSLPSGNPVVTGTVISSTWWNNTGSDLATALTQSIAYDGQTTPVANLPMGGFKHTSVADATAVNQYATFGQLQNGGSVYVATVGGTADAITLTPSVAITAYAAGQSFEFLASGTNTTNVTVAVSGLASPKAVTKNGSTALVAGDIVSGELVRITYDGTRFQVTKIKQGTASVQDIGTSGATLGLLNANKTDSGNNTNSGNNTHSGTNTLTGAVTAQNYINYAATSGTDTYTASLSPAIASYVTGAFYVISFGNANATTTPTLNLNSLGAKTIVKEGSAALVAGDIPAGHIGIMEYNGTNMVLTNPKYGSTTAANGCSLVLLGSANFSAASSVTVSNAGSPTVTATFSTYKKVLIQLVDIEMSAQAAVRVQVSQAGSTKSDAAYAYAGRGLDSAGSSQDLNAGAATSIAMTGNLNNNAARGIGQIDIELPNPTKSGSWKIVKFASDYESASGTHVAIRGSGEYTGNTTANDGVEITPGSGNFTGTILVYGVKAS